MKHSLIYLSLIILLPFTALASKHKKDTLNQAGIHIGGKVGCYFANKFSAQNYNGSGLNNINQVLNVSQYYQDIKKLYGFDFTLGELPSNVKYQTPIQIGFFLKYYTNNHNAFYFQFDFSSLKTSDAFTLYLDDPGNTTTEKVIKTGSITGGEKRNHLYLGFQHFFGNGQIQPYLEIAGSMNNTKVTECKIKMETLEYSIMNMQNAYYQIEQGGIGWGVLGGAGLKIMIRKSLYLETGFTIGYESINIKPYDQWNSSSNVFVRLGTNKLL